MEISGKTRLLAVLGDPIGHTLSPAMHNAAIHALGLDAAYVALATPAASLSRVLAGLAAIGAAGNVTIPHKEATERFVARKTGLCERAGACNTFWTEGGELVGDNTDVTGVLAALKDLGAPGRGGRWLVIGTGGSARAVSVAAAEAGAELYVKSRSPERARDLVRWAGGAGATAHAAQGALAADVVINATPLGLRPTDPLPVEPPVVKEVSVALDLVYVAGETPWVRAWRAAGVRAADGRAMLVHQGVAAFAHFFPGEVAPVAVMRAAVERALRA